MGVAFDDGACTVEAALDAHERALAAPVADVDLRASLLRNTAHFLIAVNRLADARRVLRELEAVDDRLHPRLRLVVPATRWRLARADDSYPEELAAVERGFAVVDRERLIPPERVGLARLMLHWQRLQSALANHDVRTAEADVAAVRQFHAHSLSAAWWSWELPEIAMLELSGRFEEGLGRLRRLPADVRHRQRKTVDVLEATLLIRLGQVAEADGLIDRLARDAGPGAGSSQGAGEVAEADVAALRGLRAMAVRELEHVWEAAEVLSRATRTDHPLWASRANELLIEAGLATGRAPLARRLLEREDVDRAKARYRVPWARLFWQEGDRAGAAEHFARALTAVLPDYPGYVARQLQFALELTAYDAARLWALALEHLRAAPASPPTAPPNAPDSGAARGTIGRRRHLLRLFDEYRRLTRAQVVALLGCAPATATRDLGVLVAEGEIQRVMTSAHLRTSYFVRKT